MEEKINLHSDINNIQNFRFLLERYKDYNSCIRDIKINTLLGDKCLFEIEDMSPGIYCDLSNGSDTLTSLNTSAIYIDKLSFKINTDLTILEFKVYYKILDTKMGKLVTELQSFNIPLVINPKVSKWGFDKSSQVIGFYIDKSKLSQIPTTY